MLNIRCVSKKLGDNQVLDQVNLELKAGSVFGLVGPNGAGKSTTIKILSGILLEARLTRAIEDCHRILGPEHDPRAAVSLSKT